MKILHNLKRDERGATIVELALITPILATMLIGAVDLSFGYSEKLALEQAAQRGTERVMQQRSVSDDYSDLKPEVAAAAGVSEDNVTVTQWLECNGVVQEDGTDACENSTDIYARYVEVKVVGSYTPLLGSKWLGANDNGSYTIEGIAGIRVQ